MKATIKIMVLLTVLSTTTFATEVEKKKTSNSNIEVIHNQGDLFKLVYHSTAKEDVTVKIVNQKGTVIYKEKIKNIEGFMRPYNFSNLAAGTYNFVVEDANGTMNDVVEFGAKTATNNAPYIKLDQMKSQNDLYRLTVVNYQSAKVVVNIVDRNSKVLYHAVNQTDGNYSVLYNLKNATEATAIEVIVNGKISILKF